MSLSSSYCSTAARLMSNGKTNRLMFAMLFSVQPERRKVKQEEQSRPRTRTRTRTKQLLSTKQLFWIHKSSNWVRVIVYRSFNNNKAKGNIWSSFNRVIHDWALAWFVARFNLFYKQNKPTSVSVAPVSKMQGQSQLESIHSLPSLLLSSLLRQVCSKWALKEAIQARQIQSGSVCVKIKAWQWETSMLSCEQITLLLLGTPKLPAKSKTNKQQIRN